MEAIIDFIMTNYIWILVGSIIIILSVIGYYAEKTNFGQGKENVENEPIDDNVSQKELLNGVFLDENEKKPTQETKQENIQTVNPVNNMIIKNDDTLISPSDLVKKSDVPKSDDMIKNNGVTDSSNLVNVDNSQTKKRENTVDSKKLEENFEKLNKEFNEILPEKDFIDDELLEEIDNLSLDRTQKIKLIDIPDLDDVDLPEIRNSKLSKKDIWKF